MADKNFKVSIDTSQSNPSGIDRTAVAIKELTAAEDRLRLTTNDFLTAAQREAAEVERMVRSANRLAAARDEERKSILGVVSAAQSEQAALDLLEAKRRQAARGADAAAQSSSRLGNVVNQVGFQVTDFAVQVNSGTSAVQAFSQQAPQAIGVLQQFGQGMQFSASSAVSFGTAFSLVATEVVIGAQLMYGQYKASMNEWDAANKRIRENNQAIRDAVEWFNKQEHLDRMRLITDEHRAIADEIQRQVDGLNRANELRAAQSGTAQAQASAAVTQAQNSGGDVVGAKAGQIAVNVDSQLDALASKLSESEANAVAVQAALDVQVQKNQEVYAEAKRLGDTNSEAVQQSMLATEAAAAARDKAVADLENLRAITEEQKKAILASAEAGISDLGKGLTDGIEAKTKEVTDKASADMNKVAAEQGDKLAADARGAFDRYNSLLTDSIPDSQQMEAITAAVRQFRGSQSTMLSGLTKDFDEMLKALGELTETRDRQAAEIKLLRGRIAQFTGGEF